MSLKARYAFFTALVALFIIITPIVVLFTAGYRYNFAKGKIEQTGILVLDTNPENANIYLNNELQKENTPLRIKNLLPDNYSVKIEKTGYHIWEKILTIKSKLTTFAEDIVLFKNSLPMQVVAGDVSIFSISNKKDRLAYEMNGKIMVLDLKSRAETEFLKTAGKVSKIIWSPDDSIILVEEKTYPNFKIINLKDKSSFIPSAGLGINFKEVKFDLKDSDIVYGLKLTGGQTGMLYQIDLKDKKIISSVAIGNAFIVSEDKEIFTTEIVKKNKYLFKKSFDESITPVEITIIPTGDYRFLAIRDKYITMLHLGRGELVLINLENSDDNTILESGVKDAVWVEKGTNVLIIQKDFEILVHSFVLKSKELITRYGETVKKTAWHPLNNYIFFNVNKSIEVIEMDSRGGSRNKITLANFDEIGDFVLDKNAEKIYFIGKIGSQQGMFELEIK